jgi:hypothetical protein
VDLLKIGVTCVSPGSTKSRAKATGLIQKRVETVQKKEARRATRGGLVLNHEASEPGSLSGGVRHQRHM